MIISKEHVDIYGGKIYRNYYPNHKLSGVTVSTFTGVITTQR